MSSMCPQPKNATGQVGSGLITGKFGERMETFLSPASLAGSSHTLRHAGEGYLPGQPGHWKKQKEWEQMDSIRILLKLLIRRFFLLPSFCKRCGRTVHDFSAPEEIWRVIEKDIKHGSVLCYDCFCELCAINDLPCVYALYPISNKDATNHHQSSRGGIEPR